MLTSPRSRATPAGNHLPMQKREKWRPTSRQPWNSPVISPSCSCAGRNPRQTTPAHRLLARFARGASAWRKPSVPLARKDHPRHAHASRRCATIPAYELHPFPAARRHLQPNTPAASLRPAAGPARSILLMTVMRATAGGRRRSMSSSRLTCAASTRRKGSRQRARSRARCARCRCARRYRAYPANPRCR